MQAFHKVSLEHFPVVALLSLLNSDSRMYQPRYLEWCNVENFVSKLPNDIKLRKQKAEKKGRQTTLDPHVREKEQHVPYSDALFNEVARHWLIATDQVRA